ncbi:MAG: zinc metalloprotease HtpX [Bryobacteraceae bacterium]|nr:zinc metalloprotease HtpX [Bryobacteraceae bacterium]MDW8378107.1 zinc metalloprotease HtpX [Bryobacterales bacterium]
MNSLKTVLLLGLLSGLLLAGGQALGGRDGLVISLFLAVLMNFFSYFFSEKIAILSSGAQRVSPTEHPEIWARIAPMTKRLCERMGLPMPKLWVIPEHAPNAFATGRNPKHSSVAVTVGLLELMNDREVEAVISHELGHILNRDILISSIAATVGAAITFLARSVMFFGGRRDDEENHGNFLGGLAMVILAPIAAMLIQMAISRTREYGADAAAAKYMGSPEPMISALRRLDSFARQIPMDVSPTSAHMYIIQPLTGGSLMRLFSTHPSTEQRIAHLQRLR